MDTAVDRLESLVVDTWTDSKRLESCLLGASAVLGVWSCFKVYSAIRKDRSHRSRSLEPDGDALGPLSSSRMDGTPPRQSQSSSKPAYFDPLGFLNRDRNKAAPEKRSFSHLHHLDMLMAQRNLANTSFNGSAEEQAPVYQVVLTGGPCAGKSSSMDYFGKRLREHGFDVYMVPEVPTLLMNAGCVYPGVNGGEKLITFETSLIELQLQMEQTFYNIAKAENKPSVILYDRGLLDVAAYLPRDLWTAVLNHNQWLRDGMLGVLERYDLILHLVSAADGAEEFYNLENSTRRRKETIEEARELDRKIKMCWKGHPHHRIVDNSTDFQGKLERAFQHLYDLIVTDDDKDAQVPRK